MVWYNKNKGQKRKKTNQGEVIFMVDSNYVRYKDHFKKKSPSRGEHLEKFQWKKGQTGNPEGRPTGSISITETLKKFLRRNPQALEDIVIALIEEGRLGNMTATKEMLERIDGKVAERHTIEGELPIKLLFIPAQEVIDASETTQIGTEDVLELSEGEN